jgi:glucose/arabinose dehydrogenase
MKRRFAAILVASLGVPAVPAVLLGQGARTTVQCDPNNGGLILPVGFCALVVAEETGGARHLVVASNGDVYVALRTADKPSGIVALRDTNADGRADTKERFGDTGGTGILFYGGHLYLSQDTAVVRFPMKEGQLLPTGPAETVVSGFARQQVHATKSLAFDDRGGLYVNVGNPSNACTEPDQTRTTGLKPCAHQDHAGGVWRFDANRTGQVFERDGSRFMRGLRQTNSLRWHPLANALYLVQHGRNGLNRWPEHFNEERNAETPSEELLRIADGSDFGFPYCYFDRLQGRRVLAPEYGGDGRQVGDCAKYPVPVTAFPAHWAPNDLLFYTGSQFPRKYYGGALIAFHGSGSRAPLPQGGYKVVFQPMQDGKSSGTYETFADGFAGKGMVMQREEAAARPMGLAQGPDGSLYISDSVKGKIWRVIYRGGAPATQ